MRLVTAKGSMSSGAQRGWAVKGALCAALLGLVSSGGEVSAQEAQAEDGPALFEQARFDEAQAWFRQVVATPGSAPAAVAQAHVYLAALALAQGDATAAEAHVAAAVALDPASTAPPGAPPELDGMLRGAASSRPEVAIEGPECRDRREPLRLRATATVAPPGLVAAVTLRCQAGAAPPAEERSAGAAVELELDPADLDPDQELTCTATAASAAGASLRTVERRFPPCEPGPEERGWRERMRPWGWVGVGGGAVAVTLAIVLAVVLSRPDAADVGPAELVTP